jgi:hypothetical protein
MDSITVLPLLPLLRTTRTFFYLDAHWYDHLPLAEETEFIFSNFDHFVVMVDDFQVPEDSGYKFDDYGPGRTLTLKDFPFDRDARVSTYFPARNSNQESGRRRGCAVLASQSMTPVVDRLDCLVRHRFQTDASWGCGS